MVNLICPVMSVRRSSSPMAPGQEPLPQPVWEGDVMSTQSPLRTNGRVGPSGCLDGFSSTWGSRTSLRRGPPCLWDTHLSLSHDAVCSLEAKVVATSQSGCSPCLNVDVKRPSCGQGKPSGTLDNFRWRTWLTWLGMRSMKVCAPWLHDGYRSHSSTYLTVYGRWCPRHWETRLSAALYLQSGIVPVLPGLPGTPRVSATLSAILICPQFLFWSHDEGLWRNASNQAQTPFLGTPSYSELTW